MMGRTAANHPLTAPLPFAAMVACVIATFLALDHFATADEQLLLGAATWGILIASCAFLDREDRARALLVVRGRDLCRGARLDRARRLHLSAREPSRVRPAGARPRLPGGASHQPVGAGSPPYPSLPLGGDRPGRGLGRRRTGPARPNRRARGDHRGAPDLRAAPRASRDPVRGRLPDGGLPRDLRHLDRRLALGGHRPRTRPSPPATRRAGSPVSTSSSTWPRSLWRRGPSRPSTAFAASRCSTTHRSPLPPAPRTAPSSTPGAGSVRRAGKRRLRIAAGRRRDVEHGRVGLTPALLVGLK